MKKIKLLLCGAVLMSTSLTFAQTNSLEAKEGLLKDYIGQRDALNGKIAGLEADINAMKPKKAWKIGGFGSVNFNQASFVNWAQGGENSITTTFFGNAFANYAHKNGKFTWDNSLDLVYGMQFTKDGWRKNDDRIELNSKAGYKLTKSLYLALPVNVLTQISPTIDYTKTDRPLQSMFFAPGYIKLGLGAEWRPKPWLNVYVSPATGKITVVRKNAEINPANFGIVEPGKHVRAEFGAAATVEFKKEIIKNVGVWSRLDLFNNYTDKSKDYNGKANRGNIDVDWQTRLDMKVNKYISAFLYTYLKYDHDMKINIDDNKDGVTDRQAPRSQFKQSLGVGFNYRFSGK